MKKFLITVSKYSVTTSMALAIAFSPLAQLASIAQADTLPADTSSFAGGYTAPSASYTSSAPAVQSTNTGINSTVGDSSGASSPASTATAAGTNNTPGATDPTGVSCSWSPSDWDLCFTNVVYAFTVGIGSGFAYVAAEFFNLAVNLSLNGPIYALTFISTGWTTARDLANMAFIFILIYIAFMLIFEAETSHTMSLLAGVIVIALLVNFSFFFTRLVIDAGNILSIQFYNSIQAPSIQSTAQSSTVASAVNTAAGSILGANMQTKDLTASIMGMLQLQNLFNSNSFTTFHQQAGFFTQIIVLCFLYIGAAIMFYLLTVTFVTVGIKFLVRIVILWFLIIFSPLAFVARATPEKGPLRHYFKDWLEALISHAFYPVAFMFIFLILTNFTNQMGSCTSNGSSSSQSCLINDVFTSLQGSATSSSSAIAVMGLAFANVAIRLGFVIAILYLGLKAADSVSVMGASAAQKAGNWAGGKFKASTLGLGGVAFRETIGHHAQNTIDTAKKNPPGNIVGQYMDFALRKNVLTPLTKTSIGGAKSYTDVVASRKEVREDWNKNVDEHLVNIKNREDEKELAKLDEQWNPLAKKLETMEDELKQLKSLPPNPVNGTRVITKQGEIDDFKEKEMDPLRPRREQLIANMGKMEGSQVTALAAKDLEKIIKHISDKQIKAIKDSLKYSRTEKDTLERKWNEQSTKAPLAESREQLKKLGELHEQLQVLHVDLKTVGAAAKPAPNQTFNVNLGTTKKMKKEIEDRLEEQEKIRDDRLLEKNDDGKRQRSEAGEAAKKLKKALENITKLEEKVKDIPDSVGGTRNEGEFVNTGK
ncbi:MAG TPA: hypothetical protein VMR46_02480 [Candidatus Paceibacterota bacterium]|nr:hypothetical protein [Candidatus Paceibacterota bacterium]